jgi:cytochrome c oxidase subunit 2
MSAGPWLDVVRGVLNLPEQASTIAPSIDALHFVVIGTTMTGAFGVALVAAWFVVRYRKKLPDQPTPRIVSGPGGVLLKIATPLVLFVAFWIVGFRQYVRMESPPAGAMEIYVTAKQWMWKFSYPDGRSSIDVLTVPVGRPVKLVMTSRDVIHSFYVPAFRTKQDVVPGRFVTTWFEVTKPGTYDVFCAEYCGVSHSRMRAVVVALSPDEYGRWRDRKREDEEPSRQIPGVVGDRASMATFGERVARERQCLACHSIDGQRHVGPTWVGLYLSTVDLADGRKVLADEAYLTRSMMDPAVEVHAGFSPVMPSYLGVLDAEEAGALVAYIESLRDVKPGSSGITLPVPSFSASARPRSEAPP